MALLVQFLLRLTFGLAVGMAITSSRHVTSGYFRNHLYVTLGLASLATLVSQSAAPAVFWYALGAAVASYAGSVCWLYENARYGKALLVVVAVCAALGLENPPEAVAQAETAAFGFLWPVSNISSGLLLGITMAAMLLGHWYLNTPTMDLIPLRRLLIAMGAAVALQALVSGLGLWGELANSADIRTQWVLLLVLRWAFGLLGVAVLTWMAWQTLKIPNTQSATGILYVAVIGTFVGETMGLLLSTESMFPL